MRTREEEDGPKSGVHDSKIDPQSAHRSLPTYALFKSYENLSKAGKFVGYIPLQGSYTFNSTLREENMNVLSTGVGT
jgi:hypothetical protein